MKSSSLPSMTSTYGASARLTSTARSRPPCARPQPGAVVEVVGDHRAGGLGRAERLEQHVGAWSATGRRRCPRCAASARPRRRTGAPSRHRRAASRRRPSWPRSYTVRAGRRPNPRSVKLSPTRAALPKPSNGRQHTCRVSTPPASISASTSRPTSLSTRAVTTAVRSPKQRRRARATLYSPPPSHTSNERAVRMRLLPGSRRSITSPSATQSQRASSAGLDRQGHAAPLGAVARPRLRRRRAALAISSIAVRARADGPPNGRRRRPRTAPAATPDRGTPRRRRATASSTHVRGDPPGRHQSRPRARGEHVADEAAARACGPGRP